MFDFTICKDNSPLKFKDACKKVESYYPDAKKDKLLVDVDGSVVQTYNVEGNEIDIFDDYNVGAVYIKADLDLSQIFN